MTFAKKVVRAVDADRGAMATTLSALVAIPTENPPATGYRPCVALLESTLTQPGFPFERIDIPSPPEAPRAAIRAWLGESVSHRPQEFVKMGRMAECAKIYALTAARMLGGTQDA